jgi:ribosomal protein S18 acetylase RimI-like enzyme
MSFQEPWGLKAWACFSLNRNSKIEVVTAGKELVGYIATLYDRIYNLAIHPKYRRRGLGRMIVHESHATKTTVHENDLQSQLFFRACGFRCVKIRSRYYGNGDTGYEFLLPT